MSELAFPNNNHPPSKTVELLDIASVPGDITSQFVLPEILSAFRKSRVRTSFVSVPKTAIYKNDGAVFGKNYIGAPRKGTYMEPEPKTTPV